MLKDDINLLLYSLLKYSLDIQLFSFFILLIILFIFKFIENTQRVKSITVMVQKEVADRLTANPGNKDYSAITVKVKSLGGAVVTRKVLRNMFYPIPNVDSAVVRLDIKPIYRGKNEQFTDKVVKTAFLMRRKTLINNLTSLNFTKEELSEVLVELGIDLNARGETLSPEQFVALSDKLIDKNK